MAIILATNKSGALSNLASKLWKFNNKPFWAFRLNTFNNNLTFYVASKKDEHGNLFSGDNAPPLFNLQTSSAEEFHNTGIYQYSNENSTVKLSNQSNNDLLVDCCKKENKDLLLVSLIGEEYDFYGYITTYNAEIKINCREGRNVVYIAAFLHAKNSYIFIDRTNTKTGEVFVDVFSSLGYKTYKQTEFHKVFAEYLSLEQEKSKLIEENNLLAEENKFLTSQRQNSSKVKTLKDLLKNLFKASA